MRIAKVDDEIKKWKNFRENLEGFDQELANKREAIRIATGDATLIERQRDEIANLFSEVDALLIDSTKDLEDTLVSLRGTVDSASDALTDSMHTLSALEETTASLKKLNIDNVQSYLAAENEVREMLLQKEKKINAFKKRQEKKGRE